VGVRLPRLTQHKPRRTNMAQSVRYVVIALALVLASNLSAQAQTLEAESARTACRYELGSNQFRWCVSATGNIVQLTSPDDYEHIAVGSVSEGYAVCTPDGDGGGPYVDNGSLSSGWADPVLVAEPTETGVTIERTTTDGRFTLRQQFTGNAGNRQITVRMTLTNNGGDAENVRLLRSADLDIDNTRGNDVFDKSSDSAWARQVHAVSLSALNHNVDHVVRVSGNLAPRNCGPANQNYLPSAADNAVSVRYDLGELAAGESKSVRYRYRVY
jgi:hypothetical protein